MYDEKKEQLKEALTQNLSKEAIEEKLKEEKLKQDTIKNQKLEKQKKLFYLLATIFTLIIISFITYLLVSNKLNNEIKKENTNTNPIKEVSKEVKKIESSPIEEVKKTIKKEEVLIKKNDTISSKEDLRNLFNTKKFTLIKCYNYNTFQKKPPLKCKEKIKTFVEKNSNAVRFEVIGIVGESDIKKANKMSENKQIQKYIINGISRDRVIQSFWTVKEIIGNKKIILTPVNYNIISKDDNKGIIIRAYHN
ncbi:hypothetical protein [Arcobacter sp. CECT 8985]|uniref:hypothetical protein n=1 Tax=Arcobacter sp. CECT 8985 TaxID=1935424 RepID=UPI00100B7FB8|nr:hypothetical protein [Arcobacter sp. CECT 8985]RXJ86024.1 hypothetical protein CRU93_10670 [Arcobacter sp. CECT 8985]